MLFVCVCVEEVRLLQSGFSFPNGLSSNKQQLEEGNRRSVCATLREYVRLVYRYMLTGTSAQFDAPSLWRHAFIVICYSSGPNGRTAGAVAIKLR